MLTLLFFTTSYGCVSAEKPLTENLQQLSIQRVCIPLDTSVANAQPRRQRSHASNLWQLRELVFVTLSFSGASKLMAPFDSCNHELLE